MGGQGVDRLGTHTVESHGKLENIVIVLGPGVDYRNTLDDLPQGDPPSMVPDLDLVVLDADVHTVAVAHNKLVDGVVHNLFQEYIDPVVLIASVTQTADIHTGPQADMLQGTEGFYFTFIVFRLFGAHRREMIKACLRNFVKVQGKK